MSQQTLWGGPEARPDVAHLPGELKSVSTLAELRAELPLEQRTARMYGRTIAIPRLECWHGPRPYSFGGRTEYPQAWTPALRDVRLWVEEKLGAVFDSCFANLYRDGDDCIAWHADDESWIGPVIASVSFGSPRRFVMRHKLDTDNKHEWRLGDGDLFVMRDAQRDWDHCVPRTRNRVGPRLNLTFRQTVGER